MYWNVSKQTNRKNSTILTYGDVRFSIPGFPYKPPWDSLNLNPWATQTLGLLRRARTWRTRCTSWVWWCKRNVKRNKIWMMVDVVTVLFAKMWARLQSSLTETSFKLGNFIHPEIWINHVLSIQVSWPFILIHASLFRKISEPPKF